MIYEELCRGCILDRSRELYRRVVQGLADQGAEALILGRTEISLLLFDSTALHAATAVEWMLAPATMAD